MDGKGIRVAMRWSIVIAALWALSLSSGLAHAAGCAGWDTELFFKEADAKAIENCIEDGVSLDARDIMGFTPLHTAAFISGDPAVTDSLLKAGADPNARANWDLTPLHMAAWYNPNPAVIVMLVEAGADPMARNWFGGTAYDLASKHRNYAALAELQKIGGADHACP